MPSLIMLIEQWPQATVKLYEILMPYSQRLTQMHSNCRYQKLWKSYVKLRHLLANSPKVKQIDKQKLTQREVRSPLTAHQRTNSRPWNV